MNALNTSNHPLPHLIKFHALNSIVCIIAGYFPHFIITNGYLKVRIFVDTLYK